MVSIQEAHAFAYETFLQHGVNLKEGSRHGWSIRWDRHPRYAGQADPVRKRVTFSADAVESWGWAEVTELVLHELGHVLAGPGHEHDRVWRKKVTELGGTPEENCPPYGTGAGWYLSQLNAPGNAYFVGLVLVAAFIVSPPVGAVALVGAGVAYAVEALRARRDVLTDEERRQIELAVLTP